MIYKILQILKAARLLLLIILLLIAISSQLARTDTSVIWRAGSTNDPLCVGTTAEAVFASCPKYGDQGHIMDRPHYGGDWSKKNCYAAFYKNSEGQLIENNNRHYICPEEKTCEAKDLTNPNPFGGDERLSDLFILLAPPGIDAADWYSDKFNSCENNCLVINSRFTNDKVSRSVTEADGSSRSVFTKRQTGAVCVTEKPKPNEPPKPPKPADDGKPDDGKSDGKQPGQGDSGAGSDNGNGQGNGQSSGGSGSGTDSGSDNPPDPDNGSDGKSGGSGSGSGGSTGGGGQIAPDGGGTNGGQNGSGKTDRSEGGTDGQGNGQSGNGSQGGNGSGEGSDQTGGDGSVDGKGEGDGKGDGKGSISGGNCDADQAPSCKGDPIQCYIAVEQWRTACAASGQNSSISGGNCETGSPPECKGDAAQCYIAEQQFVSACEAQAQRDTRNDLKDYADGKSGIISEVEGATADGVDSALQGNSSSFDIGNIIDRSGFGWSRSCPTSASIDIGIFGSLEIDYSMICTMAQILGKVFAVMSMLFAVRYIFAG